MTFLYALIDLIRIPAVVIGLIALVGLLIQGKPLSDVVTGTIKTVLGMLIIGVGIGALIEALSGIQAMFDTGIPQERFETFVTFDEAVVSAVQGENIQDAGSAIAYTLALGYVIHIILARITPFKYLYLTGHMIWIHAGAFAILFLSFDIPFVWVVILASIVDGIYMTVAPAIAQPFMRRITGTDEIAFGHGQTLLNVFCAYVGKAVGSKPQPVPVAVGGTRGNPNDQLHEGKRAPETEHEKAAEGERAEDLEFGERWEFFRDIAISTSIIFFIISLIAAGLALAQIGTGGFENEISDGQNWFVFAFLAALNFVAGMLVLLYGVRMLLAEIVPAFRGVGERLIPGAKPALDVPVIFPFAPNSLIIGLIAGAVGQVLAMIILALIGWPVPLPSMIVAFFASGAGAIFANATGGRRGAIAGGFLWSFVGWFMISFAYEAEVFGDLSGLGAEGLAFTVPDAILPGIVIWLVAKAVGIA